MSDKLPLSQFTRSMFAFRSVVPVNGFRWLEDVDTASSLTKPKSARGPWLTTAPTSQEQPTARAVSTLKHADLHRRFSKLNTKERILRFANSFGLLGVGQEVIAYAGRDKQEWTLSGNVAEPYDVWHKEITSLAALLAIWDLVCKRDAGKLGRYVRWGKGSPRIVRIAYCYTLDRRTDLMPFAGPWEYLPLPDGRLCRDGRPIDTVNEPIAHEDADAELLNTWRFGDVIGPAQYYIGNTIKERLTGHVSPTVLVPSARLFFQPDTLLAALYTLFMLDVSSQSGTQLICAHCGERFSGRRGTKYCSGNCRSNAFNRRKRSDAVAM